MHKINSHLLFQISDDIISNNEIAFDIDNNAKLFDLSKTSGGGFFEPRTYKIYAHFLIDEINKCDNKKVSFKVIKNKDLIDLDLWRFVGSFDLDYSHIFIFMNKDEEMKSIDDNLKKQLNNITSLMSELVFNKS